MTAILIETRLTHRFGLSTPLMLAPMALASGGALAASWSMAGALGMVGGGYGDVEWTAREYGMARSRLAAHGGNRPLGCGFITWKLAEDSRAFDWLLDQAEKPAVILFSFGDPAPWARRARDRGIAVACQIQRAEHLQQALDAGAEIIIAQGGEAGGHGMNARMARGTFTLVPELRDRIDAAAPDTLLLAAGGVADGRGLAAALMLGADGALIGTRAWATRESLALDSAKAVACTLDGDQSMRSGIFDLLRRKNWPAPYDFRAYRNAMHKKWEGREAELAAAPDAAIAEYERAVAAEDYNIAHVTVGESVAMIRDVPDSAPLVERITQQAARLLGLGYNGDEERN